MSEPVTLYGKDGASVIVYGPAQQAAWAAKGYGLTPPEPGPDVMVVVMDDPAPEPSVKQVVRKGAKGKE